jgi:hypothetical protein
MPRTAGYLVKSKGIGSPRQRLNLALGNLEVVITDGFYDI